MGERSDDAEGGDEDAGADEGVGGDRDASGDGETSSDGLPGPLVEVVADPGQGRHRLPYVLGFLDGDDRRERLAASLALCLVVDEYPQLLAYVVERLVDRLDGDAPVEVGHALDYLAATRPKAVDEAVAGLSEPEEVRARESLFQSGGGFARSESLLPTTGDRPVGRTRLPGSATDADPRRVRTTDADDRDRERDRGEQGNRDDGDGPASDGADSDDGDDGGADGGHGDGNGDGNDRAGADDGAADRGVTRGRLAAVSRRLSRVVAACRFGDLRVLSDRERGRYGDRYRAVATVDGEETAVALVVFRLPSPAGPDGTGEGERDGTGDGTGEGDPNWARARRRLVGRLEGALDRWNAVDGHDRVLTVHDWGVRPRPWAALEYTDASLADRTVEAAVETTLDVASAVGHAHRHGVVHGALDPVNVAFPGTALTDSERARPLLANPGLTVAYAGVADAANYVDPRYAPPEYYDDQFGSIDHATDVHALGLLLYLLATGEHPYEGCDRVREAVVAGTLPPPSAADPDLPAALDRVVEKATATRKLKRYETVTVFRRELRGVLERAE